MSKKRRQRQRLWDEAEGKCHWCGILTVMPPEGPLPTGTKIHSNWATTDHLVHRYSPERLAPHDGRAMRRVLACRACNERRGNEDVARNPEVHARHQAAGPLRARGQSLYEVIEQIHAPKNIIAEETKK